MKTIVRIFLFSAALISFWPAGADAQTGALGPCELASPGGILAPAPGGAGARAAMIKRTLKCLQATGQAPAKASPGAGGQFVTFDPPASTSTTPTGITPDETIAGYYTDTGGVQHGFLRDLKGGFATFDPPGSTSTTPTSISPNVDVAGVYCDTAACPRNHGFVRAKQGSIATFDAPGSGSSLFPGIYGPGPPPSINPAGAVAGTYVDTNGNEHGFLRDKRGAFTTIDAPGATGSTEVRDINPSGTIVGDFSDPTTFLTGFIRFSNGSFIRIDTPGSVACGGQSAPAGGINPARAVAGSTTDPTCSFGLGYLRTPDGTITTFSVPGANHFVQPVAINPAG
jgi:hypothetical protein